MVPKLLSIVVLVALSPTVRSSEAQTLHPSLQQREVPCQVQYAQAVQTIGLARWSAPESERPSIERLLNAAAKAKELVDSSFLQWEAPLCSTETLGRLRTSVDRLQANGWLPSTPEEQRHATAAAANAELLKAIDAGVSQSSASSAPAPVRQTPSSSTN